VRFEINGEFTSPVAANQTSIQLYYGSGTAPANQATASGSGGTALGANIPLRPTSTSQSLPFSISFVVTGLALGTAYWFDLAGQSGVAADNALFANMNVIASEF
jgi:hypothetical protein